MSFTLAIIGRPNVGKSTLFNRLVGKRLALVDDTPGVTRDRREGDGRLADLRFRLFDTAGLEEGDDASLAGRMRRQTDRAIDDADLVLFMIDGRAGVTPLDSYFADLLRRRESPVLLLVNKAEGTAAETGAYEAWSLGLGEPIAISAEHAEGMAELYGAIVEALRQAGIDPYAHETDAAEARVDEQLPQEGDMAFEFQEQQFDPDKPMRLAIVGRPNAGKSTLINHLVEEDRLITGPEAGLTRDSIGVDWDYDGVPIRLFDTAGLRKRAKIQEKLEKLSVSDTMRAVQFAEVVVLLIDATLGMEKQDLRIAAKVVDEGRGLVIVLNKWDLVEDRLAVQRALMDSLTRSLPQVKGVEIVTVSALTGTGVQKLMPAVMRAYDLWNARIPTSEFNRWLDHVLDKHPPPAVSGRRIRIRYGAQIKNRPPTFLLFCNRPEALPDSYLRYLENELRRDFDMPGVPLRLTMRKGENPYAARGSRRKTKRERSKK